MTAGAPPSARTTRTSGQRRSTSSCDALRAALHLRGSRRIRTYRLDGDQCFQIGEDAWNLGFNLITQGHVLLIFRPRDPP